MSGGVKALGCSAALFAALVTIALAQPTRVPSYSAFTLDSPAPEAQPNGLGGGFGSRVATVGDLNKDGTNDVLVASAAQDVGGLQAVGRVWAIDGRTRKPLTTFDHPAPQGGAWFGFTLAALGDVNGDGFPDVAIAAPAQTVDGVADQGKVYVLSGHGGALVYTRNDPDPQVGAEFGRAMISTGDLNGDGVADFVVGAPKADSSSKTKVGMAYVFSGKDGSLLFRLRPPDDQHNARFGRGLSDPGDLNGDGADEIVVGAPSLDDGSTLNVGRAYVFDGKSGRLLLTLNDPQPRQGVLFGFMDGERGAPGDVNGDGVPDVLVPAILEPANGVTGAGRAYIFSGKDGSLIRTLDDPTPQNNGMFGFAYGLAGDVNHDGRPDLIVGQAPFADPSAPDVGGAYVFDPRSGLLLLALENPTGQHGSELGASLAAPGDVNGDRRPDFFVAAPRMDVNGSAGQGRVIVFQSHDVTPPTTPAVRGPRRAKIGLLSYLLTSQDADNSADELVYLCSFDTPRLHQCTSPLRQKLRLGTHVLRVRARDPAGNQSPESVIRISIVR